MSAQPLTYEGILKLFAESDARFEKRMEESRREFDKSMGDSRREFEKRMEGQAEIDRMWKEATERIMKKTNKRISDLGSRVGEIIVKMVKGDIVGKFQALGYTDIEDCYERVEFGSRRLGTNGEIDLLLENGDVAILIEVKTTLETADVRKHIGQMEKYRRHIDAKGRGDKRRFIGAVAGAIIEGDAETFAHENGIYVIVQSGKAVEIVPPPKGFKAKEW